MKVRQIGAGAPIRQDNHKWGYTFFIDGHLMISKASEECDTPNAAKQKMREEVARLRRVNGITFRRYK